jgi:hypothetical protein
MLVGLDVELVLKSDEAANQLSLLAFEEVFHPVDFVQEAMQPCGR